MRCSEEYECVWVCVFKQKTGYERRISDWSSDVCSSDLLGRLQAHIDCRRRQRFKDQRRDQLVDRPRTDRLAAGVTVGRRELTLQRKGASNGVAAALAEDAVLAIQGAIVIARSLDDNAVFDRAMKRIGTRTLSWTE